MTAVEVALDEIEDYGEGDDWAVHLVELAAFHHIAGNAPCVGFCIVGAGRALCGNCEWQLSGRMDDRGEQRSARFALFALAMIGAAVAAAVNASATFKIVVDADDEGQALMKALGELRTVHPAATIADVKIRAIPDEDDAS